MARLHTWDGSMPSVVCLSPGTWAHFFVVVVHHNGVRAEGMWKHTPLKAYAGHWHTVVSAHVVVHSLSHVQLFAMPWTVARQAPLSSTISLSLLKLMFIESVMLSNHLILCCPLPILPSIFPNISVFSNELALSIRRPKYWSFSLSISTFNEYSNWLVWLTLGLTGLILQSKELSRVFSSTTVQKHQFFSAQPSNVYKKLIYIY